MIRFYLDTDDDFDVVHGLDITDEVISWDTERRAHPISRSETDGSFEATLRRGRASASWWRVGRLIEGRVGDFVFFRGFLLDAVGIGNGRTKIRALTWLQHLRWRGRNPDVVGLTVDNALRAVVNAAADGFPGAVHPSAALVESIFGDTLPRRLYWRATDRPLYWRSQQKPLYWGTGPDSDPVVYNYGLVGVRDTVGATTLVGPPQPVVSGQASGVIVDRLTSVEYQIENYEYGFYEDEVAVLAAGERGWVYSGGDSDISFIQRNHYIVSLTRVAIFIQGRYEYDWHVGSDAVGQVVGRQPDVQESSGVIYRQENVSAPAGVSSWTVALRDRGRPAEVTGSLSATWTEIENVSVGASANAGDLLVEIFNDTGAAVDIGYIEVSGTLRVYQGGLYDSRATGRYGGRSVELRGVFGGAAGLEASLDYWRQVLNVRGPQVGSVTLDGRTRAADWQGLIGGVVATDALEREGIASVIGTYWIVGIVGSGRPEGVKVRYELMPYVGVS